VGDLRQRVGVVLGGNGDPHDLAAGGGQLGDLLERGVHVGGQRGGHRLDRYRGTAAHGHRVLALAHHDLAGFAAGREWLVGRLGHTKVYRHDARCLTG